jgi:hypothetical protein
MSNWSGNQTDPAAVWIKGCTQWMYEWVFKGWKLYYINFMFEPLHVPTAELVPKMRKGIIKFYGRFCTGFVHNGRAKSEQERMPQLWLFPDLPVRKNKGTSLRDVTINGGLHYNGPMLIPPVSRFKECPIKHLEENQARYARNGIKRINIVAGGDIPGLADYAAKTIKNHRADEGDILILPRSVKELPEKKTSILDSKDRLLKDIQSRFNVCDEMAQKMRDDAIKEARF